MNKRMIAICTIALMGMASLVSCNRTANNQQEKQDSTLQNPQTERVDTDAIQGETDGKKVADPTIREILHDGAKSNVDYNIIDSELEITIVYKETKYQLFESQLTDEARNRMEEYLYSAAVEPVRTLSPSDVKPNVKLSDAIIL